jgi:uncharacterized spore protein YtfJ
MKVEELFAHVKDSVDARIVYAAPVEKDGATVIAAARVFTGGGGGIGQDKHGQQGEGGGLGLMARPVGAFVIQGGQVRWEPAVDANRIVAVGGTVLVAGLLLVSRAVGRRRRGKG